MSKIFNDPIHGHIQLPQLCVQIIDTPVFQRLRQIKQLGATYKVYPGASNNRFEHCLGVCHLAGKFVDHLRVVQRELVKARSELDAPDFVISDKDALCLQVAGLCHDLGHGPLSHVFETYFIHKIGTDDDKNWTHEKATCDLLDYLWEASDGVFKRGSVILEKTDLAFIKELIHKTEMTADQRVALTGRTSKKDFLYEIVSNDENSIDVDKWDYFARDCYHLGFKNNFDHNRLIQFSRLIEVEEGGIGKRWHICYREKEVENLYHMFYTRVILHKRACLHKTTKIIEIMYMEALEKVNDHFKIKGTNDEEKRISDCIRDPVAYCKLTDNIFDLIRYMGQSCNEQGSGGESSTGSQHSGGLEEQTPAIQQAIQILNNIEDRKIYKFIGEAIPDGGQKFDKHTLRAEERKVEDEISQLEIDGRKLNREDFLINILEFSYGGKDNPVNKVYFYVKSDPDKAKHIEREQVSFLLPTVYCEQVVRMYSRKPDEENVKQCRNYFENWCRANEMKGKWQFYAAAHGRPCAATTSSAPSQ